MVQQGIITNQIYMIFHNPTSTRSEVGCCEKNDPPSSMVVDDIDKGDKSSDDLENEYDGIQNVETTGSDSVRDDDAVKKQDGTSTLRFIETSNGDMVGKKNMSCKQPTQKRLGASASETVDSRKSLENAVSPVYLIKAKIWATDANSAMNLKTTRNS